MKRTLLIFMLVCLYGEGMSQFKHLRYDEHYEYLKDSSTLNEYERMKFTRLTASGTRYVSFGGEVRFQYFKYKNEEWGDAEKDSDGYMLSRLLLHGDWHLSSRIRIFTQLQSSIAAGRIDPSPVELNELDVHQVFADVSLVDNDSYSLLVRAGRQELNYGSSRLISTREGPNNRQSFDGAKILFKGGKFKVDAFYTRYVISKIGIFNDRSFNSNVQFGGVYITATNSPVIKNFDLYYLVIKKQTSTWNDVSGVELRHSIGTRIWGGKNQWSYDFEGVVQFGDIANNSISAWTLSSNTSYVMGHSDASPTLGFKTEFISGDKNPSDGKIESFNPLYPRGAYFGYAALIGPSNLFDVHPSITIPIGKNFTSSIDYDIFWRFSNNDGIYNPASMVIYPAGDSASKFIGHQVGGILEYTPNKFVYFRGEVTFFKSGPYIKSVGTGKDIVFMGITTTLKF